MKKHKMMTIADMRTAFDWKMEAYVEDRWGRGMTFDIVLLAYEHDGVYAMPFYTLMGAVDYCRWLNTVGVRADIYSITRRATMLWGKA